MKNRFFCLKNVTISKSIKYFLKLFFIFTFISSYSFAANYPLEVLQPQENLDVENRFYKAYPGFEYNVRMAVKGGDYPFKYKLTESPPGMTINGATGEISWPSPNESGTAYDVTAEVTDAESSAQTVSWTIQVTTDGFLFVDAVNGKSVAAGGTGTKGNPWKSLNDVYEGNNGATKYQEANPGSFVYWRAGTYGMDAPIDDAGGDGMRVTWRGNVRPQVWLAYPGDAMPVINQDAALLYFADSTGDFWMEGLNFHATNARGQGINISSSKTNVVFRRNIFSDLTQGFEKGNSAHVFVRRHAYGYNFTFQDNVFRDVPLGYGILVYAVTGALIEDNLFENIGDHPVGLKVAARGWDVRSNRFRNNGRDAISLHHNRWEDHYSGDTEVRFNVVERNGGFVHVLQSGQALGYPVYVYRNTIYDNAQQTGATLTNGPFYWANNVIVNDLSGSRTTEHIYMLANDAPERVHLIDNLTGFPEDGIIDDQGNLTAEYAEFIGTYGHQIGNPPSPPVLKVNR